MIKAARRHCTIRGWDGVGGGESARSAGVRRDSLISRGLLDQQGWGGIARSAEVRRDC